MIIGVKMPSYHWLSRRKFIVKHRNFSMNLDDKLMAKWPLI